MTEERFKVDSLDGLEVYGTINKSNKRENEKAIIHVHGLTGSIYEPSQHIMANTFPDKYGYDIIRVELYSELRPLEKCTVRLHAQDINAVAYHFKNNYDKIFGAGHSYGGPSLALSDQKYFTAFSFWDPSYPLTTRVSPENTEKYYKKYGENYINHMGGIHSVMSSAMWEERKEFNLEKCREVSKSITIPIQVIHAADGILIKEKESYHTYAQAETDHKVVKGTTHLFWEEGSTAPLLRHTRKWFDQF